MHKYLNELFHSFRSLLSVTGDNLLVLPVAILLLTRIDGYYLLAIVFASLDVPGANVGGPQGVRCHPCHTTSRYIVKWSREGVDLSLFALCSSAAQAEEDGCPLAVCSDPQYLNEVIQGHLGSVYGNPAR